MTEYLPGIILTRMCICGFTTQSDHLHANGILEVDVLLVTSRIIPC